jgi:hypothetical protein
MHATKAEFILSTKEVKKNCLFLNTSEMQLKSIFPTDGPAVTVFSGCGISLRLVLFK